MGVFRKIKAAIMPTIARIAGATLKATEVFNSLGKKIDSKNPQKNAHKPPMNA